jgi:hypothetical protein
MPGYVYEMLNFRLSFTSSTVRGVDSENDKILSIKVSSQGIFYLFESLLKVKEDFQPFSPLSRGNGFFRILDL